MPETRIFKRLKLERDRYTPLVCSLFRSLDMRNCLQWLLLGMAMVAGAVSAQVKDETLLLDPPIGYKVDSKEEKGNIVLIEMVPEGQSAKAWTEMLSIQFFLGVTTTSPQKFQAALQKQWLSVCTKGQFAPVADGAENGYPFAVWSLSCPLNEETGKPEITYFKAIQGADSFYLVQKAFRFDPSQEQVGQWMKYLRFVSVCDTRSAAHPCPRVAGQGTQPQRGVPRVPQQAPITQIGKP